MASGFLASLFDGISLVFAYELFAMVTSRLDTGQWQGPIWIAELCGIWLIFGFVFSLLPNIVVGITLGFGMPYILSEREPVKRLSVCVVSVVGIFAATCYLFLLLRFEILFSRDTKVLVAILVMVQMLLYGWLAIRARARYVEQLTIAALIDDFAAAASLHHQSTLQGRWQEANEHAERISGLFRKVAESGNRARQALLEQAESDDLAVASMAAAYSLVYDPERSLAALERISQAQGLIGFQAKRAMQRWAEGEWDLEQPQLAYIRVAVVPGSVQGTSHYNAAEYDLAFEIVPKRKSSFVYHVDMLTICSDGDMCLVSLDAYTYHKRWAETCLMPPQARAQGNIQVIADYDENRHDNAPSDAQLAYSYDAEKRVLRIGVLPDEVVPKEIVQIGENLLVEIGPNRELVRFWLLDLSLD